MNLLVASQIMITPGAHAQDIPNNMLAFFDQEACPEGWTRAEIPGRSLLDRGNYIGSRSDGVIESVVFAFGNKGGEVSHKMTIEEMPSHVHPSSAASPSGFIVTGISDGFRLTGSSFLTVGGYDGSPSFGQIGSTGAAGNSQPHNNMPPYYVATLCRKTAENTIRDLIVKVSELNLAVEELKRGSKVPGPAGPQGAVGVPGIAGKDGAPGPTPMTLPSGQNGPTISLFLSLSLSLSLALSSLCTPTS